MKNYYFLLGFLFMAVRLFSLESGYENIHTPNTTMYCPGPDARITSYSLGSISFDWTDLGDGVYYKTWYYRHEDGYKSQEFNTADNYFIFSGLPSGTYDFHFATVCGGELSDIIIIVDIVL